MQGLAPKYEEYIDRVIEDCEDISISVGEHISRFRTKNHTEGRFGGFTDERLFEEFLEPAFGYRITREKCEQADCLHPCYGGRGGSVCTLCWRSFMGELQSLSDDEKADICNACHVPPLSLQYEIPNPHT